MFAISLVIIVLLTVLDQIIKIAVNSKISLGDVIEVLKFGDTKVFSLTHIRNTGAAWSIMSGKIWFLIALPIVVCLIALVYMFRIRKGSKLELVSLSLLISGGIGNLIDRIRLHEVIDYIKFEPIDFPIFNFADICVVIGAILFCISILVSDVCDGKKKKLSDKDNINKDE